MNQPGAVPSISAREAAAAASSTDPDGPLIVDVREHDEFAAARIAGVALVPMSELPVRYRELPRDRPLLLICHVGGRSSMATQFLRQQGWPDVTNIEGGMVAWMRDGLPVRTGAPEPGEGDLPAAEATAG